MQLVEFSIFDSKLELFQTPWFSINTALGKRMFTKLCNSPALDFNRFPADYTLFETGVFDQDTGLTTPYITPKNLGLAVGYIRADWPQEITAISEADQAQARAIDRLHNERITTKSLAKAKFGETK